MAEINISTEAAAGNPGLFELTVTVEDITFLLKSYTELLFDAGQFDVSDAENATRGANQIYALLTAVRTQVDHLEKVSDALRNCRWAIEGTPQ